MDSFEKILPFMKYVLSVCILLLTSCSTDVTIHYPDGGYNYPQKIIEEDNDFYFYPIKSILSKEDSFYQSYAHFFYEAFDEPNLSLKPANTETFRLTYVEGLASAAYFITLTKCDLFIKEAGSGSVYYSSNDHLSEMEKGHLSILKKWYPIDTTKIEKLHVRKAISDSIKKYPQLLDSEYFKRLYEKSLVFDNKKIACKSRHVSITSNQYYGLINQLNNSGFWSLPYKFEWFAEINDPDEFTFEANTSKKYKVVSGLMPLYDNLKFARAIQKIIDYAGLNDKIKFTEE